MTAISGNAFVNLDGQLTGWGKNQGLDAVVLLSTRLLGCMQMLKNRDGKRGSFTGSCLSASQKIAT